MVVVSLFCRLHPDMELEDAWRENEEGENDGKDYHSLVAVENVDEFSVGILWHEVDKDIGNGVVDPMEDESRDDGACAIIHPPQQQADEESVCALGQVEVDDAKEQS